MNNLYPKGHKKVMNKAGDGKIISMYWFLILFLIAAAVVYMASMYYGNPYDIREYEAKSLSNKIADCISMGGYIDKAFLENEIDILNKCGLNFEVEDISNWTMDSEYYVEVEINLYGGGNYKTFEMGNINLKDFCSDLGGNYNPVCKERSFYVLGKEDNKKYQVDIKSAVRKTEKNVQ